MSSEIVSNRPLSGRELLELVVADLRAVLEKDGLFSPYIAFGRIGYEVEVRLHMDNVNYPEHRARAASRPARLADPAPDALEVAKVRSREVRSPNIARIEAGLPIKIQTRVGDALVTKELHYEAEDLPVRGPEPVDTDLAPGKAEVNVPREVTGLADIRVHGGRT